MSGVIEFWFDFSSPYGYFASHGVDRVAAKAGRSVLWKPFMLGSVFKETGARPVLDVPLKGPYCIRDWNRLGRYHKVPWALPDPFPIATLGAARAFYWLEDEDPGVAHSFAQAIFRAYFGEGRNIAEPEVVADVAAGLEVDRDAVLAVIDSPRWKQRLKDAGDEAVVRGVCGSPYFIVDGEGFWGSDRLTMVAEWLDLGGW
jgi:2-hydroxychromene-2-carboxylate isomerase